MHPMNCPGKPWVPGRRCCLPGRIGGTSTLRPCTWLGGGLEQRPGRHACAHVTTTVDPPGTQQYLDPTSRSRERVGPFRAFPVLPTDASCPPLRVLLSLPLFLLTFNKFASNLKSLFFLRTSSTLTLRTSKQTFFPLPLLLLKPPGGRQHRLSPRCALPASLRSFPSADAGSRLLTVLKPKEL